MARVEASLKTNPPTPPLFEPPELVARSGPQSTGNRSYKSGDYIGTPWGQLLYLGRQPDGQVYVQSRTTRYVVPSHLHTRDEIRAWAINTIRHGGIGTESLYPSQNASPVHVAVVGYTAISSNRTVSNLSNVGLNFLKFLANRFPMADPVLTLLSRLLPRPSKPGESDLLRLEVNTSFPPDNSSVLHLRLNLAGLIQLGKPTTDQIFQRALEMAPTAQAKAEVLFMKRLVENGWRRPGFSESDFAQNSDLRITFDPVNPNGFRLGLMFVPVAAPVGSSGIIGAFGVSPRVKFDAAGKPIGMQLVAGFELCSQLTKGGFRAGVGCGVVAEWNGGIDQSPIRKDEDGRLGIEVNVNGQLKFMRVPGLAEIVELYEMGSVNKVPLSRAPEITARDIAKNILKTDDPKVIEAIEKAAQHAEKTGQIVDASVIAAGTLSQIATAVTAFSLQTILAAAGLAAVLVGGPMAQSVADGTIDGLYARDVRTAKAALDAAVPLLQKSGALSRQERSALNTALSTVRQLSEKWFTNAELTRYYNRLPKDEQFPFTPAHVRYLEQKAKEHP